MPKAPSSRRIPRQGSRAYPKYVAHRRALGNDGFVEEEGGPGFYTVNRVLKRRETDSGVEYLVNWHKWTRNHNTWEPLTNFTGGFSHDCIQAFEASLAPTSRYLPPQVATGAANIAVATAQLPGQAEHENVQLGNVAAELTDAPMIANQVEDEGDVSPQQAQVEVAEIVLVAAQVAVAEIFEVADQIGVVEFFAVADQVEVVDCFEVADQVEEAEIFEVADQPEEGGNAMEQEIMEEISGRFQGLHILSPAINHEVNRYSEIAKRAALNYAVDQMVNDAAREALLNARPAENRDAGFNMRRSLAGMYNRYKCNIL